MKIHVLIVLSLSLGLLAGCQGPGKFVAAPAGPQMVGNFNPAVAGPGPGVIPQQAQAQGQAAYAPSPVQTSQIMFVGPRGAEINWDVSAAGAFDSTPLICPGRENFPQNGIYRLKLTKIPGHEGIELFPTLEVAPTSPRTVEFLTHQAIAVSFTEEDITQVLSGNFVTKVIYLPDPKFQEMAIAVGAPDTLVSTRLDPGVDPITEADRRGSIMAIVRMGNIDVQTPAAPGTTANYGSPVPINEPYMAAAGYGTSNYYVSGVTGPAYGQPATMTPMGIPGTPQLPTATQGPMVRNAVQTQINTMNQVDYTRP